MKGDAFLHQLLQEREERGLLRRLKILSGTVDFSSNDYLGFSRSAALKTRIVNFLSEHPELPIGSTGSRLLAGNSLMAEELESVIARFHGAEAGLLFNSGYDANLGFFASVPQRNDVVLYDELIHASVHDGMKMGKAERISFQHNDVNDLETKLKDARKKNSGGNIFVAVESLYSMEGDSPELIATVTLCEKYGALLIVDEAHASGVIGERGEGLVSSLGLQNRVFARLHTFGKALGCHGAILLSSQQLCEFLINFARSLIYTTALPYHDLAAVHCAYQMLPHAVAERRRLNDLILFYNKILVDVLKPAITIHSPIQSILIAGNERVREAAAKLQQRYDVRPLVSPTVPKGKERLRICLHAFNQQEEVLSFLNEVKEIIS